MQKTYHFILFFCCIACNILPTSSLWACGDLPETYIDFIENKGQWHNNIHYQAELAGSRLFLENDRLTYVLMKPEDVAAVHDAHHSAIANPDATKIDCHAFYVHFEGANPTIPQSTCMLNNYRNYFQGNDPSKWAGHVGLYNQIDYVDLYDGIDMRMYGEGGHIKYDFIVAPNADASNISLRYEGLDNIFIQNGNLHLITSVNTIVEQQPYAYQYINGQLETVVCNFALVGDVLEFNFPNGYNTDVELIIDPLLIFSTYSGSTVDNWGFTATYDNTGHLYGGGAAFGVGYPTTAGAFQIDFAGGDPAGPFFVDISIVKYSLDGSSQLFATYLGGSTSSEMAHSLWVNNNDELFVYGSTGSSDYPVTPNAYDSSFNGGEPGTSINNIPFSNGSDIIVTRFTADGSDIIGSTYIGGIGNDGLNTSSVLKYNYADEARGEIFLDDAGDVYIGSTTRSPDFPTSTDAYQELFGGGAQDGCVIKLQADLSDIVWSTYIGGSGDDATYALKLGDDNNLYFSGGTTSNDFPTTSDAVGTSYNGGIADAYLAKLSNNGSDLLAATYLGTNFYDQAFFVDLDPDGNVYAFGQTAGNYPIEGSTYSIANSGMFLHKLNSNLNTTLWSTVIGNGGGNPELAPTAFLVDNCFKIYLSGWGGNVNGGAPGSSTNGMPITSDAFQSSTDGSDMYFMILAPNAASLEYATFFGSPSGTGEHVDGGTSRFDKKGVIYQAVCAGCGGSDLFPTTSGAWSEANNASNCNLGNIKFDFETAPITADFNAPTLGCAPFNVTFENTSVTVADLPIDYYWDFGNGQTSTDENPAAIDYTEPGDYTISLVIVQPGSCNGSDTTALVITVSELSLSTESTCPDGSPITLISSLPGGIWSGEGVDAATGIFDPTGLVSGNYEVSYTLNDGICEDTAFTTVTLFNNPIITILEPPYCLNDDSNTFMLSISISGDDDSYSLSGDFSGTVANNTPITLSQAGVGATYTLIATGNETDCSVSTADIVSPNCPDCSSNAGTMPSTLQTVCNDGTVSATTSNEILFYDPNTDETQLLGYIIHTSATADYGTILAQNLTGSFIFSDLVGAEYYTQYYISAVVGFDDSNGFPLLDDPCSSISIGTPVLFFAPIRFILDENCDYEFTGDYAVIGQVYGGYPEYEPSASYTIVGDYMGSVSLGESFLYYVAGGGNGLVYNFEVLDDGFGCAPVDTLSEPFDCNKTAIELLRFAGQAQASNNLISWATAAEIDNNYFTLEVSHNTAPFSPIATITSKGNSNTIQSYEYHHKNVPSGIYYYRLIASDFNGNSNTSNTIVIERNTSTQSYISISPIPAKDALTITYQFTTGNPTTVQLSLFDVNGKCILQQTMTTTSNGTLPLNINHLSNGIYFLQLKGANTILPAKFIKH